MKSLTERHDEHDERKEKITNLKRNICLNKVQEQKREDGGMGHCEKEFVKLTETKNKRTKCGGTEVKRNSENKSEKKVLSDFKGGKFGNREKGCAGSLEGKFEHKEKGK